MQAGSRHGPGPAPHARRPERRHRPPSEVRTPAGDPEGRPGSLARGHQRADRAGSRDSARGGHGGQPAEGCRLPRERRARHLVHVERPHPLPSERIHAARRDLVRVPRDPARGSELRDAQAAERCPPTGRGAPRARPRHRRDRLGQDDDARVDAEPHQPDEAPAHRHDRGPDRVPARGPACIVNQREVGLDTQSFGQALRRALRQDPDVILIGELRDAETAETALQAAESGHLVFSTMHTIDAAETLGRLTEFFPAVKQQMIRSILAGVLRGVISQRLIPKVGGGRVAAVEVMVNNARIADLIRDARPDEIHDAIDEGEFFEMQTFSKALIDLVVAGQVDQEIAANASTNRHDFLVALERALKQQAADERAAAEPPPIRSAGRCAAPRFRSARRSRAPRRPFRADVDEARCGRDRSRSHSSEQQAHPGPRAQSSRSWGRHRRSRPCRAPRHRTPRAPCSSTRLDRLDAHAAGALVRGAERALAPGRSRLRDSVAGAGRDQQDRVELRPQHGAELRRRRRLDAVHALDLAPLGNGRERRRSRGSLGARGRDLLGPATWRPPAGAPISTEASSRTTTPTGTCVTSSSWRRSTTTAAAC